MVNVFVLVMAGIFSGMVANDTPAVPFATEQECKDAMASLMAFARSHGVLDSFTLACFPMVIVQQPRGTDKTSADAEPAQ